MSGGHLGLGVAQGVLAAAGGDGGEVALGSLAGVDEGPGLQCGQADRVEAQRGQIVGIQLQGEDLVEVAQRRPAEGVDQGGVDLPFLEEDPGLVEGPGPVHLHVALGPGRPHPHRVEGHHEAERAPDEVVGRAGADEVDVVLGDADVAEHLGDDRHQHLDLVVLFVVAHVGRLGERGDRHRTDGASGGRAHRYSLKVS